MDYKNSTFNAKENPDIHVLKAQDPLIRIDPRAKNITGSRIYIIDIHLHVYDNTGKCFLYGATGWEINKSFLHQSKYSGYMVVPDVSLIPKGYHSFAITSGELKIPLHFKASKDSLSTNELYSIYNEVKEYQFYIVPLEKCTFQSM